MQSRAGTIKLAAPDSVSDVAPAVLLGLVITVFVAGARLLPLGETTVLVRLPDKTLAAALGAAIAADAIFVTVPTPGFVVLRGKASRIRGALGLAVVWKGKPSCSTKP